MKLEYQPFVDLKRMILFFDVLTFPKDPCKKILENELPKKFSPLSAAYSIKRDTYFVNPELKKETPKFFKKCWHSDFFNRIIWARYIDQGHYPYQRDLPIVQYKYAITAFAVHEVRHRFQYRALPNLFQFVEDYSLKDEFSTLFSISDSKLTYLIQDKSFYTPKSYIVEIDAVIVSQIFLTQVYLYEQNGDSFEKAIEKAARVITMDSKALAKCMRKICFLGKSFYRQKTAT